MKTINQFIITVGILLCSLAVWADDAKEKAALETYFTSRGTTYQEVIALAEANQELRDSVNTLYKNSFAVIDTVDRQYVFQGFITLDGQKPELPKVDTLYISEEAAAYLGNSACAEIQYVFKKELPLWMDEMNKCAGDEAPARMMVNFKPVDPLFSELPIRIDGIGFAINGGMAYVAQRKLNNTSSDAIEEAKCFLNSDIYFKSMARMMEAFQTTDIYKNASKKPLIYDVPLAKARRLEFLSRDTLDYLHFVGLKDGDTLILLKNGQSTQLLNAKIEYSLNNRKSWTNYAWPVSTIYGDTILLNANDTVWFRAGQDGVAGKNKVFSQQSDYYNFMCGKNDSLAVGGNIMSLLDASLEQDSVPTNGVKSLFSRIGANLYAYNVQLPATKVGENGYFTLFSGNTNLTHIPELPATVLGEKCYGRMFMGCTQLEVDTISDLCNGTGTELIFPQEGGKDWNQQMFANCHTYDDVQLGGHYCVQEWKGPRHVTLTSIDSTRVYDGTPVTADSVIITGGLHRKFIQFSDFASQTEVGTYPNTFTYKLKKQAKEFTFDTIYGTLKVDYISTTPVSITIDTLEKKYDGTPLNATYSFTGVEATDSVVLKLDTTTLTDAGIVAVKALDCQIMRGDKNVTNGYIVKPVQPGSLKINPREITITSSSASKEFDKSALTNDTITFAGDGFATGDTVTITVQGSQDKVGQSDNTFTYLLAGNAKEQNYTITTEYGKLTIYCPVHPVIEGMYDQWNIVLDQQALTDTLLTFINGVTLLPENVTWYIVSGEADKVNEVTGAVENDQQASPATGFYHTEGKAMNGQYYCVVKVPEAETIMGISYFQSNVVFVNTPAPTSPIRKAIKDGQLIIIRDGKKYNAQGQEL